MKNLLRLIPAATVLTLIVFGLLFTLPGLQALAATNTLEPTHPLDSTTTFYIFDAGWISGTLTQQVEAVPQVLAWTPGEESDAWSVETGFLYDGFLDPQTGIIYFTEQRNIKHDSILNVPFSGDEPYTGENWSLYLTALNSESGEVVSRTALDMPMSEGGVTSPFPIGSSGTDLFIMNYSSGDNLFVFDLATQQIEGPSWKVCMQGNVLRIKLISPATVAALCIDGSSGIRTSITLTDLETDQQKDLVLPALGEEDYQSGNGMFHVDEWLFVIDSDGGVLVRIDLATMEIVQSSNYREGLAQEPTMVDEFLAWLGDQVATTAAAKRWMALTAVSPDGHWLVVDGGFSESQGSSTELLLIDLQTLKAVQRFDLPRTPEQISFGSGDDLLVLFNKSSANRGTEGVLLDISTGQMNTVVVPTHGWVRNLISGEQE